jgi:hypothetical protein
MNRRQFRIGVVATLCWLLAIPHAACATMSAEKFSQLAEPFQDSFFLGAYDAIVDEYVFVAMGKYGTYDSAVAKDTQWSCIRQSSPGTFVSMARDRMRQDRNLIPSFALRHAVIDRCGGPDFRALFTK